MNKLSNLIKETWEIADEPEDEENLKDEFKTDF